MKRKDIYDVEEYKRVLLKAQKKGLDLLMRETRVAHNNDLIVNSAYAVVINRANLQFTINDKGIIYLGEIYDGPYTCYHTWYDYSLEEAEKIIDNYKEEDFFRDVKFYGFVRQYEEESEYVSFVQVHSLEMFSRMHGIKYETIFGCRGGFPENQEELTCIEDTYNIPGIHNVYYSCKEFFSRMAEESKDATVVLCVTDYSRLDGELLVWKESKYTTTAFSFIDSYPKENLMNYEVYVPTPQKDEDDGWPF